MSRRMQPETRMKKAVDKADPILFAWALLDIARIEWGKNKEFKTISTTDIKNILQAIMNAEPKAEDNSEQKATIHEIKKYL